MFNIFSLCTFWHEMVYYHGVRDFTEMCSEVHFTYYVAFDQEDNKKILNIFLMLTSQVCKKN
jgi:hypothetical protein